MNKEKFLELYNKKVPEKQMAKELSVSPSTIRKWRLKYGLKPYKVKFTFESVKDDIIKYHSLGMSDAEIARKIGTHDASITKWRNKLKLERNVVIENKVYFEDVKDKLIELHSKGLNDVEISKIIQASLFSIRAWRKSLNLSHNDTSKITPYTPLKGIAHHAFIGHSLGDGHLSRRYEKGHARGVFSHKLDHSDYFYNKVELFKPLISSTRARTKVVDNKSFKSLEATLKTDKYLTEIHEMLYKNKERVLSKEFLENYNEVSLAYHFMDDGSNSKSGVTISCCALTHDCLLRFQSHLKNKLGIHTNLHKGGYVYIPKRYMPRFYELVSPYIIPCMEYKIPNEILYEAHVKQGELLGTQETDNQQPSFASNSLEGPTTRFRVLSDKSDEYNKSDKSEDSNESTSALPVSNN